MDNSEKEELEIKRLKSFLDYLRHLSNDGITEENEKYILRHLDTLSFFSNLITEHIFPEIHRLTINRKILGSNKRINSIADLKYPPEDKVKSYGRCNYPNQSILYSAFHIMTVMNELKPRIGDLITQTTWKVVENQSIKYCPIFINQPLKENTINPRLIKYQNEFYRALSIYTHKEQQMINLLVKFVADSFSKQVDPNRHHDYIFSAYFSNKMFNELGKGEVEAIYYPSVQEKGSFENLAIKPSAFDKKYILSEVIESVVVADPSNGGGGYLMETISHCDQFDWGTKRILWHKEKYPQPPIIINSLKERFKIDLS